jgi:hypothetical protein
MRTIALPDGKRKIILHCRQYVDRNAEASSLRENGS